MVKAHHGQPAMAETAISSQSKVRKQNVAEQTEIQIYLSKLKELVPDMPKNRKVSKLEVIHHVIDYICDLQLALESHPSKAARQRHLMLHNYNQQQQSRNSSAPMTCILNGNSAPQTVNRQPLGLLSSTTPNALAHPCIPQEVRFSQFPIPISSISVACTHTHTVTCLVHTLNHWLS